MGRQYIGEIGKTDNGIVRLTTDLYDARKSLPLDIELYQHRNSLPQGKKDPAFLKKPELALNLIERTLSRGYHPGIVLIEAGSRNNTSFLLDLENRQLKYLGGIAKNRKVTVNRPNNPGETIRVDDLAQNIPREAFTEVQLNLNKPKTLSVAIIEVEISRLSGKRSVAIVMNQPTFSEATEIDYFLTNVSEEVITPEWVVETYSQRNWVEVFYREAQGVVRTQRISSPPQTQLNETFYLGNVCLYFYCLASTNWGMCVGDGHLNCRPCLN